MALTVKKRKGLIIPKTPGLILPGSVFASTSTNKSTQREIIEEEIRQIIKSTLGVNSKMGLKRTIFIPVYSKKSGEKEITKIYMKYKTRSVEKIINVEYIESFGVTLVEFFDYIITHGAKEIQNSSNALDIV